SLPTGSAMAPRAWPTRRSHAQSGRSGRRPIGERVQYSAADAGPTREAAGISPRAGRCPSARRRSPRGESRQLRGVGGGAGRWSAGTVIAPPSRRGACSGRRGPAHASARAGHRRPGNLGRRSFSPRLSVERADRRLDGGEEAAVLDQVEGRGEVPGDDAVTGEASDAAPEGGVGGGAPWPRSKGRPE